MIYTMMAVCFYLYVFFMVYFAAGSGDIPICSAKQQVTASVGDTAVLSCHLSYGKSIDNLTVVWTKTTEEEDIVINTQNKQETFTNQRAAFLNRMAMYEDWIQHKDATLNVAGMRAVDAGEYTCWVIQSPPSRTNTYKCCTIRLHVAQDWKGDKKQLVVAWSIYISFLSLCLFILYRCSQKKSPLNKLEAI